MIDARCIARDCLRRNSTGAPLHQTTADQRGFTRPAGRCAVAGDGACRHRRRGVAPGDPRHSAKSETDADEQCRQNRDLLEIRTSSTASRRGHGAVVAVSLSAVSGIFDHPRLQRLGQTTMLRVISG